MEACLLQKLPDLFTADSVYDLEDNHVRGLAGESNETVMERARLAQKLKVLENGLHCLRQLDMPIPDHSQWLLDRESTMSSVPYYAHSGVVTATDDGQKTSEVELAGAALQTEN